MKTVKVILALGVCAGIAQQALAADAPENVIKYRQSVMSAVGGHTGAIAGVVKGEVGFTDHVAAHARGIHEMSKLVVEIFPEGTSNADGFETRALPKVWEDWSGFKEAAEKLEAESEKLVEVAEGGDSQALGAQFMAVGKACGGCHKPFRAEKK